MTMNDFAFYSPTRFVFGRGAEEKVGSLVKGCGGKKFRVIGNGSNDLHCFQDMDYVRESLTAALGIRMCVHSELDSLVYKGCVKIFICHFSMN